MRECVRCKQSFEPKNDIHFFCSDKCRRAARSSDYRKAKLLTLLRDGYACTECGLDNRLECHHIVPLCMGGDHKLSNLQTLCRTCHKAKHKNWRAYGFTQRGGYDHAA